MKKWVFASLTAVGLGLGLGQLSSVALAQNEDGKIEGRVYEDADADGIRDAAEEGIEGVTVRLSGKLKRSAETDRNGKFSFDELPDGSYDVTVELDEGWLAVKDFTAYKDLEVEGATLDDVDFALQGEDAALVEEEPTLEATEAVEEVEATEDEAAAEETEAADDASAAEIDEAAATEDAVDDAAADDTDSAADDEAEGDEAETDDAAMAEAAAELMDSLSESGIDPAVLASIQKALDSAREDGDSEAAAEALEEAMAALPKDLRDQAAAMATDMAVKADADSSTSMDGDADSAAGAGAPAKADAYPQAGPSTKGGQPADSMPGTGGGALALGGLLAAALAALGGLGRVMERRRA